MDCERDSKERDFVPLTKDRRRGGDLENGGNGTDLYNRC